MSRYTNFEIDQMLESIVVLVDTREQPTQRFNKRMEGLKLPFVRKALSYGDYSFQYTHIDGSTISMADKVVVERKMNADELAYCFTKDRLRFSREFERAKVDQAKMYLLVENESWERICAGKYKSKLNPKSFKASLMAWSIRYKLQIMFCKEELTGSMIHDIFRYELKERLMNEV